MKKNLISNSHFFNHLLNLIAYRLGTLYARLPIEIAFIKTANKTKPNYMQDDELFN